ncbi:protein YoaL [Enterobacter sp. 186315]
MKIRNLASQCRISCKVNNLCYRCLQRKVNLCQKLIASDMFSLRLIDQEYRAVAHRMDRHRRQSSIRPSRASTLGDPRHASVVSTSDLPTVFGAPFSHSFSRSLSWNS